MAYLKSADGHDDLLTPLATGCVLSDTDPCVYEDKMRTFHVAITHKFM